MTPLSLMEVFMAAVFLSPFVLVAAVRAYAETEERRRLAVIRERRELREAESAVAMLSCSLDEMEREEQLAAWHRGEKHEPWSDR